MKKKGILADHRKKSRSHLLLAVLISQQGFQNHSKEKGVWFQLRPKPCIWLIMIQRLKPLWSVVTIVSILF